MNQAFPEALVIGYEPMIEDLALPDVHDRHVLAAAIAANADAIVTTRDFPASTLDSVGMRVLTPDELVSQLVATAPGPVVEVIREQAGELRAPAMTVEELLDRLTRDGLAKAAQMLHNLLRK